MRRDYLRLGLSAVIVAAAIGLLIVSGAAGAKASRTVALRVKVTGAGTVRVAGKHALTCRAGSCSHTFQVRRWQRITVSASPHTGWKLTKWHGACKGSSATCSLRLKGRRTAAVAFVPPGNHLNPFPLGTAVTLTAPSTGNWPVKVDSVIIDADAQAEAVYDPVQGTYPNAPPAKGWQYTLVNLTLTYKGSGSALPSSFLASPAQLWAEGRGYTIYPPDACVPPQPDLGSASRLSSGESTTGNLCYEIHSKDASSLLLSGQVKSQSRRRTVWFALR